MKALELTIHPPLSPLVQEAIGCNMDNGFAPYFGLSSEIHVPGLLAMHAKRFSDAELAAEWWRSNSNYQNSTTSELRTLTEVVTVQRFATTPHYFEEEA